MDSSQILSLAWAIAFLILLVVVFIARRARRRGGSLTAGVVGATYELQSQDKRRALELIVDARTGERDPEDKEGNLPDLEAPKR
jgi:hypothetical protein